MAKATLEYDLPEESKEFETAINGNKYISCLQDFDNFLRNKIKHADLPEEVLHAYEECREKLYEIAEGDGFSIWD